MRSIIIKILILLLVFGLLLSACDVSMTATEEPNPQLVATVMWATVSTRLTQIAVGTMIAEATQVAMYTATPTVTETPTITVTPSITATPTSTLTLAPTATNTPIYTNTPVTPTATKTNTPIPTPCNQAAFVADVTMPDNSTVYAGQSFYKTWRIKNTGTCNWTTAYSLYFLSGNSFSAPASIPFTNTVKPGETIDLTIPMISPSSTGDFTSNWMIAGPNSSNFGVGTAPGTALTVKIKVTAIPPNHDPYTVYDFVANYCSGQWRTNASFITCPTTGYDYKNGTISRTFSPKLEDGTIDDEGALITIPSYGGDGFIQGQFPQYLVHSGDRFRAILLCTSNAPKCSVTFDLSYKVNGTDTVTSLGTWDEISDKAFTSVDIDLSALDGQSIIFFLKVTSKSDPTDDFAQWMAARITHP
ncbi:MAG: hypothetical protein CVU42_05435 [Chloroflexi bacterium HGW-Chloroflexi-4]|jgi:hypothetical protein|nr:MAG: hypothetical protein CVU42_05435 [Chloroflexi bacterium HGW-Chloroflexi-4]